MCILDEVIRASKLEKNKTVVNLMECLEILSGKAFNQTPQKQNTNGTKIYR